MLPVFLVLLVLWPAGTLYYWEAYVYCLVILVPMIAGLLYFIKHDPEALRRRLKTREKESAQKLAVLILSVSIIVCYLIAGFDKRFDWSTVPFAIAIIANLAVGLGYLFTLYVFKTNSFAARTVEVEENQQLIDSGPYHWVRHPMYVGMLLMYLATPIALGSWWGLVACIPLPLGLVVRIVNEEKVLHRDLQGYTDYTHRTRWRLIPGIW